MHIYSKDQQAFHLQRTRAEKWFTRGNTLLVAIQLVCFICAIIRTSMNASNSMDNSLFSASVLSLNKAFLVPNCSFPVARSHAFFRNVTFDMRPDNIGYFVSRGVLNIRYVIALSGVHMVVSAVNRVWFETNTHEIRYHFVVFRKDMVTTWEILLMIMGIVVTMGITEENRLMQQYLNSCSTVSSSYYCSALPFIELYISFYISLGVTVINLLVALWNQSKPNPRDTIMKEEQARRDEIRALAECFQQGAAGSPHGDFTGAGGGGAGDAAAAEKGRASSGAAAPDATAGTTDDNYDKNDLGDENAAYNAEEAEFGDDDGYGDESQDFAPAMDDEGYNDEGYNDEGYNEDGYNDEGYGEDGYNEEGYYDGEGDDANYDNPANETIAVDEPIDGDFPDDPVVGSDTRATDLVATGASGVLGSSAPATPLGLSSGPPPPPLTAFEVVQSTGSSRRGKGARNFPPPSAVDDASYPDPAAPPPPARPERANKMLAPPTPLESRSAESTDLI